MQNIPCSLVWHILRIGDIDPKSIMAFAATCKEYRRCIQDYIFSLRLSFAMPLTLFQSYTYWWMKTHNDASMHNFCTCIQKLDFGIYTIDRFSKWFTRLTNALDSANKRFGTFFTCQMLVGAFDEYTDAILFLAKHCLNDFLFMLLSKKRESVYPCLCAYMVEVAFGSHIRRQLFKSKYIETIRVFMEHLNDNTYDESMYRCIIMALDMNEEGSEILDIFVKHTICVKVRKLKERKVKFQGKHIWNTKMMQRLWEIK
jgi:hypothetical protein